MLHIHNEAKLTSWSSKIRLYPFKALGPFAMFEIEGHIRVTLAFTFQEVLELSREENRSNMVVRSCRETKMRILKNNSYKVFYSIPSKVYKI